MNNILLSNKRYLRNIYQWWFDWKAAKWVRLRRSIPHVQLSTSCYDYFSIVLHSLDVEQNSLQKRWPEQHNFLKCEVWSHWSTDLNNILISSIGFNCDFLTEICHPSNKSTCTNKRAALVTSAASQNGQLMQFLSKISLFEGLGTPKLTQLVRSLTKQVHRDVNSTSTIWKF